MDNESLEQEGILIEEGMDYQDEDNEGDENEPKQNDSQVLLNFNNNKNNINNNIPPMINLHIIQDTETDLLKGSVVGKVKRKYRTKGMKKTGQPKVKQAIVIKSEEGEESDDQKKITEWPRCQVSGCNHQYLQGVCIDPTCPKEEQMMSVCYDCHKRNHLPCLTLYEYSEKILFSEEIKQYLRYKKSKQYTILGSINELNNGNPNIAYQKLHDDVLYYYRKTMNRLYDPDKNYQKTNIWKKEQVRQVCLNLEEERANFSDEQIQFFQFILGFHAATINNFIVKNQRSQQAYDNNTIFTNSGNVEAATMLQREDSNQQGGTGASFVKETSLSLTQNQQSKSQNSFKNQIIINDDEVRGQQQKQQIIDIQYQKEQLTKLLFPSVQESKEKSEKEQKKREMARKRCEREILVDRQIYAQQQELLKENNNNIDDKDIVYQEFIKEKQKSVIISDEKVTRSRSKGKTSSSLDNKAVIKIEHTDEEVAANKDTYPQRNDSLSQNKNQQSEEKFQKRKKRKNQSILHIDLSQDEDIQDDHGPKNEIDLSQFNYNKHSSFMGAGGSQNKWGNLSQFHIKQEELPLINFREDKSLISGIHYDERHHMEIENDEYPNKRSLEKQAVLKMEYMQDQDKLSSESKKSPVNSSFSKDFVTKIEQDRLPFFKKGTIDLEEEEIDIILDDDDPVVDQGQDNIMGQKSTQQLQKEKNILQGLNNNYNDNGRVANASMSNDNFLSLNKQDFNSNINTNFMRNDQKNFLQDIEDEDEEEERNFLERKKSLSVSNMYAEDSIMSSHKNQFNTKIKRVFYEDYYLGQSSETENDEVGNNNNNNQGKENTEQQQGKQHTKSKYQFQLFEYLNQYLDDDELTDRIIKTPIKADAVRLYFNFEGNYTSIQSLKAMQEILPKYENLIELCINLRNCFVWMELEILSRSLRLLNNLTKISLNLSKTQIEIQHLFILVKNLNKMNSLHSLNIDLSENVFKNIDNHSLSIIGAEDLQLPNLSLHIDDFDLEQDQTQLILNVFCRKNKKLNKLYLINYGDMNKIHLVNFICGLVKRQRISEVIFRIDITELKRKRLSEIINACQSSQSLVILGFELTGKISPSVMEEFSLIGEHCKSLMQFYLDITDLENDESQILSFIRSSSENSKNLNKKYIINLKGRKLDKDMKDAISKTQTQNFRIMF